MWTKNHILDSYSLTKEDINEILREAKTYKEILGRPIKKVPVLKGKVIINAFYENSTRTKTSFELAGKYLGADMINFGVSSSSVKKGETLIDTIETLLAMRANGLVIRHQESGICHQLAQYFGDRLSIFNAGDGCHDHPTQGLLDLFTILERKDNINDKKVVIIGDIKHSRVARSNLHILNTMGAKIHIVGPKTLLPSGLENFNCQIHSSLENALEGADIVMALRLQLERQNSGLIPSLQEYHNLYGLTTNKIQKFCKDDVIVMHPGPINRNVEISSELADEPKYSVIADQVTNGVAVRMALLRLALGRSNNE